MKLLVDMNLSPQWVALISVSGITAEHGSNVGPANATDHEMMDYARINDWIVVTHDLDFSAILAATHGEKPSVVQVRAKDVNPNVIDAQVVLAFSQMAAESEDGVLLTIDPDRTRLRLLPLQPKS